jgi:hypothetical protein
LISDPKIGVKNGKPGPKERAGLENLDKSEGGLK